MKGKPSIPGNTGEKQQVPELLAPAGTPEALDAAIAEGADAVYLGLKSFNARMRSANFAYSQFEGALRSLHRLGRRLYVTVNTVFEQREADRVYQLLKYLASAGPDGIIVQDFGVLMMAREFKQLKVHASTQMNIASARGANALSKNGVSRVVLARELSLDEIKSIRQNTNMELEVFVHGALCASASGLCLFSSYLGGKSANRGLCTQACRRLYYEGEVSPSAPNPSGFTLPPLRGTLDSRSAPQRPGSSPLESGYYFSPCDLSLINFVPELAEAGVEAFKIEGRMKSAEYVGTVVSAYRTVIDSLPGGETERRDALERARLILRNDFARPKTEYFFNMVTDTVFRPEQDGGTGIGLGAIIKVKGAQYSTQDGQRGRQGLIRDQRFARGYTGSGIELSAGDSLRFHKADDSQRLAHKLRFAERYGSDGYYVSIPDGFEIGDSVYLIQTRAMTKRYQPVIPKDLSPFKRQPGRDKAPKPELAPYTDAESKRQAKNKPLPLKEGVFVQVAAIEDLYIVQSQRPAGVILPVNRKTIRPLLEDNALPFKPGEITLALDPWFEENNEEFLSGLPVELKERGYCSFIINNPGHFSLFRDKGDIKNQKAGKGKAPETLLIAGPWLYTFNSWAANFVSLQGAGAFITPLENNRQNLEKTMPGLIRRQVFVTLFAWPPLFRIKTGGRLYGFKQFSGGRGESFSIVHGDESAVVIPDEPFCITDKKPFLMEAGFRRFILDFSGGTFNGSFPLKKKLYKEVIKATEEGQPLSGISRFNWKNGFFSPPS